MSTETRTTAAKTLKVFGSNLHAQDFKPFFRDIPGEAKLDISVGKPLPGETGSIVTTIQASWWE